MFGIPGEPGVKAGEGRGRVKSAGWLLEASE